MRRCLVPPLVPYGWGSVGGGPMMPHVLRRLQSSPGCPECVLWPVSNDEPLVAMCLVPAQVPSGWRLVGSDLRCLL
eukprot:2454644-Pyramimonas_sp.AAC.1